MITVLRVVVIYLFVLIALRMLGKREFSQLSAFDLVTILLIPEIASQALVREDFSLTNALIGLSTLFTLVLLTSIVSHMSKRAATVIDGTPSILICNGQFVVDNLNRERVTPDEIFGEMHKVGLAELGQVQWGILESDGHISFVPYHRVEMLNRNPAEPAAS